MSRLGEIQAAAYNPSHSWWRDSNAPADLRDLLGVAEAVRAYCDRWIDTTFAPDDIETAALLDALARLDAVTGGETS